jgi:hypothetical protein
MKLNLLAEAKRLGVPDTTTVPVGGGMPGSQWNTKRPPDAPPVPPGLDKVNIEDVQWDAPGRAPYVDPETGQQQPGDPRIGIQMSGVRKTKGGYAYNGWWYVLKLVHRKGSIHKSHGRREGIQERDIFYWYRRKRAPSPIPGREGKIIEQYVGKRLIDKDTRQRIIIPDALKDEIDKEVERQVNAEEREKLVGQEKSEPATNQPTLP